MFNLEKETRLTLRRMLPRLAPFLPDDAARAVF